MKIIDAHCHIHKIYWNLPRNKENDFYNDYLDKENDENEILSGMREAGIDKTIIFPYPSIYVDIEKANHFTVAISRKYPDKFIPFTIIDHKPGYWLENGVKGFKEHTFGQRIQRDRNGQDTFSQKFKETYRYMEQHRVPLLLHAGINRIERIQQDLLKDTPDLIIILAHLGADFLDAFNQRPQLDQVKTTLESLKEYPNIYFDISAIRDPVIIQAAFNIVDSQKLIFGSDFPFEKPIDTLQLLRSLRNLTDKNLEDTFCNTIMKVLSLQV